MTQPDVNVLNLVQLFGMDTTLKVPAYQREYAWEETEISALFEDLLDFANDSSRDYYLLGQTILAPNGDADSSSFTNAIVDGQQRLTSLYLLYIILLDRFNDFGVGVGDLGAGGDLASALTNILFYQDPANGRRRQRLMVNSFADAYIEVLLVNGRLPEHAQNDSQENVRVNTDYLKREVQRNFDSLEKLVQFCQKILFNVWLIVTRINSEQEALDIFEKINSRGKPLNSADLLRNLLFVQADPGQYVDISRHWKNAVESVFKVVPNKAATMQYLMKGLLGSITGMNHSNPQVFAKWKSQLDAGDQDMEKFAENLDDAAKFLSNVGATKSSDYNKHLVAARYFKTVQHLPIALAGRHLYPANKETYGTLLKFIDARLILSLYSQELPQAFNGAVWPWVKEIAALEANARPERIFAISASMTADLDQMLALAETAFKTLNYRNARDLKRIRFAFACAANLVQDRAGQLQADTTVESLLKAKPRTGGTGYDIDHVFAQALAEASEFDISNGKEWINNPGNLALLHSGDNRAAGAVKPHKKSQDYASSHLMITKSLALNVDLANLNGRLAAALAELRAVGFQDVNDWNFDKAKIQTAAYWSLFEEYIREGLGKPRS